MTSLPETKQLTRKNPYCAARWRVLTRPKSSCLLAFSHRWSLWMNDVVCAGVLLHDVLDKNVSRVSRIVSFAVCNKILAFHRDSTSFYLSSLRAFTGLRTRNDPVRRSIARDRLSGIKCENVEKPKEVCSIVRRRDRAKISHKINQDHSKSITRQTAKVEHAFSARVIVPANIYVSRSRIMSEARGKRLVDGERRSEIPGFDCEKPRPGRSISRFCARPSRAS